MSYEPFEKHLEIVNPVNGQGYCPHHISTPVHDAIVEAGWKYSHTTRVGRASIPTTYFAIHTYIHPDKEHVVGVYCRPGWLSEVGRLGRAWRYRYHAHGLKKYLKYKGQLLSKKGK